MTERTILVTGATDGIGRQTALTLARRGARVLVHGRSIAKAEAAKGALCAEANTDHIDAVAGDLSSLEEVRALARDVAERFPRIDALVNNAGVFMNERALSRDGFEMTLAVNHLAPFLLAHLLLPQLRASDEPRIVNVSSIAHTRGTVDLADLGMERDFSGYRAYAATKLMNVLFTFALARRLASPFVAVNALHPGVINTKLLKAGFGMVGAGLATGAATSIRVATDPALARITGKYFSDQREVPASETAHERALQESLYALSAELTGIDPLA